MAVGLPALVVVLGFVLWAISVVGAQLECVDAARAGARAAARGEASAAIRVAVSRAAPPGADIAIVIGPDLARVDVHAVVRSAFTSLLLPAVTVEASATSATEPTEPALATGLPPDQWESTP
ncbi:hypothetical protein J5X84_07010 [Streptosporangiaceae bacterium NEAU-GS5]|nr:hypothetical protein [Streptosporangiaceae bacterium NEAU-GS5]